MHMGSARRPVCPTLPSAIVPRRHKIPCNLRVCSCVTLRLEEHLRSSVPTCPFVDCSLSVGRYSASPPLSSSSSSGSNDRAAAGEPGRQRLLRCCICAVLRDPSGTSSAPSSSAAAARRSVEDVSTGGCIGPLRDCHGNVFSCPTLPSVGGCLVITCAIDQIDISAAS